MIEIRKTMILVKGCLTGQKDKQGVSKYDHCVRVAKTAGLLVDDEYSHLFPTKEEKVKAVTVALLHDVIEDSDLEEDDLYSLGYDEDIVQAVVLLTHYNHVCSYSAYIDGLCLSRNKFALLGKLADNMDNNNEARMEGLDKSFKNYLTKRYSGVKQKLIETLEKL